MNKTKTYDFYTIPEDLHFGQKKCTEEEAKEYAKEFRLKYQLTKGGERV